MEIQPLDRLDDAASSGETPEDVAILYSWANLEGAKYRDFSANRREYRAQMRHRAAEQLRLMELRAQSEAEAAATEAEAEAAAAHAEADAASVKLAANRTMQGSGLMKAASLPEELEAEEQVELMRRTSLREAGQQARRAAAERLEAARRAEAAALADSIARREEREIAEAQASALRQAAQYAESDNRNKQKRSTHPEDAVPGRISDPYGPQVVAEGEYFERPGTPVSELEASRFKQQRDYIEQHTGVELPPFRMPETPAQPQYRSDHIEERVARSIPRPRGYQPDQPSGRQMAATDESLQGKSLQPTGRQDLEPRRQAKPVYQDRYLSVARDARRQDEAGALELRRERKVSSNAADGSLGQHERAVVPSIPYKEFRKVNGKDLSPMAEALSREPEPEQDESGWQLAESLIGSGHSRVRGAEARNIEPMGGAGATTEDWISPVDDPSFDGEDGESRFAERPVPSRNGGTLPGAFPKLTGMGNGNGRITTDGVADAKRDSWDVAGTRSDPRAADRQPTWSKQPEPKRPAPAKAVEQGTLPKIALDTSDTSGPAWLYPNAQGPRFVDSLVATTHRRAQLAIESLKMGSGQIQSQPAQEMAPPARPRAAENTLQESREQVASRWFALKGVFAKSDREQESEEPKREKKRDTPFVLVYSAAGGAGKTSLVATLGRALSSVGEQVLLTDTTSQGLLPFYFGATELHAGVVRTFSPPSESNNAAIHMVSYDFAARARELARTESSTPGDLFEELVTNSRDAHRVLVDLDGSCGWMVEQMAYLKPTILVPLAADMNSVIGLRAVERSFAELRDAHGKALQPIYLLNQFDASTPLHLDVREVLTHQLGERLLPFVIRRSSGVSEALAEGMTIIDYDPGSEVVKDYMGVANWLRNASAPATVGHRNLRWRER